MALQLNSLDWADIGAWPRAVKGLCHAGCALLVLAVGYLAVIAEGRAEQVRLQAEDDRLQDELERKRQLGEQLPGIGNRRGEGAKTLTALVRRLPSESEVPRLIDAMASAAEGSGLAIDRIELAGERIASPTNDYLELNVAIVVSGGYHGIGAFAAAVAGLPQLVILHDFELRPADVEGVLTLTATAKTYRSGAQPAGASP